MATITLKNIPDDLYDRLKQAAKVHHRSVNSELIFYLERALQPKQYTAAEHLAGAREIRERFTDFKVTEADLRTAKETGRK